MIASSTKFQMLLSGHILVSFMEKNVANYMILVLVPRRNRNNLRRINAVLDNKMAAVFPNTWLKFGHLFFKDSNFETHLLHNNIKE